MKWSYRIVKRKVILPSGNTAYIHELKEVYFNRDGTPWGCSREAVGFAADVEDPTSGGDAEAQQGILQNLKRAIKDVENYPVFHEPVTWERPDFSPKDTIQVRVIGGGETKAYFCPECGGNLGKYYLMDMENGDMKEQWDALLDDDPEKQNRQLNCIECHHKVTKEDLAAIGLEWIWD